MNINVALFTDQLFKVFRKLEDLADYAFNMNVGPTFVAMDFEENGITYRTEKVIDGGADQIKYEFFVLYEDLDKPLEFFHEKFKAEYLDDIKTQSAQHEEFLSKIEKEERETLAILQAKYAGK